VAITIDPSELAKDFRLDVRARLTQLDRRLKLVGFLSTTQSPSKTYASYTKAGCDDVGIDFELIEVPKLELEAAIDQANSDPNVHGIIVYYPIFSSEHDRYIKDLVDHRKDIEGLHTYWAKKLYHNDRFVDAARTKKALLPCTPLAIVKLLAKARATLGFNTNDLRPLAGASVTVFNRSEVVGRPLAAMLANDGAEVYSFDVDGVLKFAGDAVEESKITRSAALKVSDIVVTGVPSREFELVSPAEIKAGAICLNFSTLRNFTADIGDRASVFIPRVGPMTVAMALRNTLRLYENYHA